VLHANLNGADLRDAQLGGNDFSGASLRDARMGGARLLAANFCAADLRGARELTQEQLGQARTDTDTILPNGTRGPFVRFSGDEKAPNAYQRI
jgi:uncharacterized protein YjbI with pentapeptide repeats